MAHAYTLLAPHAPLGSANDALPDHLAPFAPIAVRAAVDAALFGVEWDGPAVGTLLRGVYDGPGGRLELLLPANTPEFLQLRADGEAARLVQALCDRTGWTALDLQTLTLLVPRPLPDLGAWLDAI